MQHNKSKWYQKKWIKIVAISYGAFVVLFIVGAVMLAITEGVDDTEASRKETGQSVSKPEESKYEVKVVGNSYADPASRRVTFTVKNTGNEAANPSCNVEVKNESSAYHGYDYITWNSPAMPGEIKYFEGLITVTNEGAAYATKANVRCS